MQKIAWLAPSGQSHATSKAFTQISAAKLCGHARQRRLAKQRIAIKLSVWDEDHINEAAERVVDMIDRMRSGSESLHDDAHDETENEHEANMDADMHVLDEGAYDEEQF